MALQAKKKQKTMKMKVKKDAKVEEAEEWNKCDERRHLGDETIQSKCKHTWQRETRANQEQVVI